MDHFIFFFQYVIFFYSTCIVVGNITLIAMSFIHIRNYKWKFTKKEDRVLKESPLLPGISIIAPAFNEETTIITNAKSLLTLDYPLYEVVIINDGSKDRTLELLIESFELVETPFAYFEKIRTKPFKRIFKSSNPKYDKLTVVDKENGGTKADASNAGINASMYPYFLCTDVDCILSRDCLTKMIQPFLNTSVHVIAVGATMRMANSCELTNEGVMNRVRPPKGFIPCFQEIEYLRSFLISKMGWSFVNAVPNVSGGLGLFDKTVAIEAGGYDPVSHAEDMDMMIRMVAYMRDFNKEYRVAQIPVTTCWTEGPPNLSVLNKQRTRWGRGLLQFFIVHRKLLFNYKYGRTGLLLLPYMFLFEFLAPVIEGFGVPFLIYFLIIGKINYDTVFLMFAYLYLLGFMTSAITVAYDLMVQRLYKNSREYLKLILFASFEVLFYHPFIVFFNLKGYIDFLSKQSFEWGVMKRKGFERKKESAVENN